MVGLCHICARKFKTTPSFTLTSPTLRALYSSANAHTSHKSRVTASVLALLVAQAIRWRYSQAWSRRCVVAFEMVWRGCNPSNPPPRSAHDVLLVGLAHAHAVITRLSFPLPQESLGTRLKTKSICRWSF